MTTTAPSHQPPRALLQSVAAGLLLMAGFTAWWASDSSYAWPGTLAHLITLAGALVAVVLSTRAVRLLLASRRAPRAGAGSGDRFRDHGGVAFGVVFGLEGLFIGLAAGLLQDGRAHDFLLPTIALVVGLHFFPMAWVFQRSLDVYLASWTTLVGAAGLVLVAAQVLSTPLVWSLVGAGVAAATASYGAFMLHLSAPWLRLGSTA